MKALPWLALVILTGLRFWTASLLPLTPDEAFQWMCANQLDWAFFDAPGGTACLVKIGILALGDGPLAVRLAFPLMAAFATLGAWLAGRSLAGPAGGWWSALALNALPGFNLSAIHATPEAPMLAGVLLAFWCALEAIRRRSMAYWLACGAFTGLAALFGYLAILIVPGFLAAAIVDTGWKKCSRHAGVLVVPLIAGALLLPAILWNQAHQWPAMALGTMQTALTFHAADIPVTFAAISQSVSLPALVLAVAILVMGAIARDRPTRCALVAAAPVVVMALYALLHGETGSPAPLLAVALLAVALGKAVGEIRGPAWAAALLVCLSGGASALALMRAPHASWPWEEIGKSVQAVMERLHEKSPAAFFVITKDPDFTAMLNYQLPRLAPGQAREVFLRESQDLSNQFGLWPRYDEFSTVGAARNVLVQDGIVDEGSASNPYLGRSAIYVTDERFANLPQTIRSAFASVEPLADIALPGESERVLHVYLCEEYQTMPL